VIAQKSRPAGNGTAEVLAGGLNYGNSNAYPTTIRLSEAAESYIDQLAVDLLLGNCELWQLSPALSQFWTFAFEEGRRAGHRAGVVAAGHRIARLEYEANLFYFCYTNRKTPADYYRHVESELWAGASA
jgi:hypothetical protein